MAGGIVKSYSIALTIVLVVIASTLVAAVVLLLITGAESTAPGGGGYRAASLTGVLGRPGAESAGASYTAVLLQAR